MASKNGLRKTAANNTKEMEIDVPATRFKRVLSLRKRDTSVASIAVPAIARRTRPAAISVSPYPVAKLWILGSHLLMGV